MTWDIFHLSSQIEQQRYDYQIRTHVKINAQKCDFMIKSHNTHVRSRIWHSFSTGKKDR